MDKEVAEHVAKILEQNHEAFGFLTIAFFPGNEKKTVEEIAKEAKTRNPYGGILFGFTALAIIYSYDCVAKPEGFPTQLVDEIQKKRSSLGISHNDLDTAKGENDDTACFRHLRNSFAHGRFSVAITQPNKTLVTLKDFNPKGKQTFEATCDATEVISLAERLLLAAHAHAAAQVLVVETV